MIDENGDTADEVWMVGGVTKQQGQESLPDLGWQWEPGTGGNPGGWWTELSSSYGEGEDCCCRWPNVRKWDVLDCLIGQGAG